MWTASYLLPSCLLSPLASTISEDPPPHFSVYSIVYWTTSFARSPASPHPFELHETPPLVRALLRPRRRFSCHHVRQRVVASTRKLKLNEHFFGEGAAFGDLNNDGKLDAVSGPTVGRARFSKRHRSIRRSRSIRSVIPTTSSRSRTTSTRWLNDVPVLGFPGVDASWYANPAGKGTFWRRHVVLPSSR